MQNPSGGKNHPNMKIGVAIKFTTKLRKISRSENTIDVCILGAGLSSICG
jgi:hypothetical protein